jgi:transposase-like protein
MNKSIQKTYTPTFKAQVALAAMAGDKTPIELASLFEVPPNLIDEWKQQLTERAEKVFGVSLVEAVFSIDVSDTENTELVSKK